MTITPEKKEPKVEGSTPLAPPLPEHEPPRGPFASYKEDQGRHVRMGAFWSVVFFLAYGCRFMHGLMVRSATMREPIGGIRIPIIGVDLTPSFLASMLVFCAGTYFVHRWQQRPRVADLLIDTEAELKRVSWPKGEEVWNASVVVILSVVIIGALLALADVFLFRVMRYLIIGGS